LVSIFIATTRVTCGVCGAARIMDDELEAARIISQEEGSRNLVMYLLVFVMRKITLLIKVKGRDERNTIHYRTDVFEVGKVKFFF